MTNNETAKQTFNVGDKVVATGGPLRGAPNCEVTAVNSDGTYEIMQSRTNVATGKVMKYSHSLYGSQLQKV